MYYAYNESVFLDGKNIDIQFNTFKNAYSETFPRFIYIKDTCENVYIGQNIFSDMYALENSINGDSLGVVRAMQSQNAKRVLIEYNTFEKIKGVEDSDYIAFLSNGSQTINGKSYYNHDDITVRRNHFKNPQKCVVKIQCSGVNVLDNFVESYGSVFTRM